jgi:cytochrome c553
MKNTLMSLITLLLLASCENNHMLVFETTQTGGVSSNTRGLVGFDKVKPIFEAKCIMCHNGSGHPKNWTNYETAKADLVKLNDRLFVTANMPSVGSLTPAEKSLIKSWIADGGSLASTNEIENPIPTPGPKPIPLPIPLNTGEQIVQDKCLSCHGADAAGLDTPILQGLDSTYIAQHLNNFKTDNRLDIIMSGTMNAIAQTLTDDDIKSVSIYLSTQSTCKISLPTESPIGNIEAGMEKAQSCLGCHNDSGAIGPVIEGQKATYIKASLNNFRNGKRVNDMMNAMASPLTDDDINDLSAYFNSKRNCK